MYRNDPHQREFVDFYLSFGGKLSASNRWVKLAGLLPWEKIEECYARSFAGTGRGAPAKSARMAFGALVIKERLGITDEETVEQITENPYLQYFLGLQEYREEPLFDPSMMVHFRGRFGEEDFQRINDEIIREATASTNTVPAGDEGGEGEEEKKEPDKGPPANAGKLLVDATCTPADITSPTDLKLLNEAREKTEGYIDKLHAPFAGEKKKPRTYRQKARRQYLAIAKQKKPRARRIRKAIGQQLRYLKRNLGTIDTLLKEHNALARLSRYEQRGLDTIRLLYPQQLTMYESRTHSIPERIVSISQPHVRPIVRGKAGRKVEFGAKVSISHLKDGYVAVDRVSWDAYNEGADLIGQIESYNERFGHYPASVHADTIYRTRKNRHYCKERNIRLSGKPLGRPKQETAENQAALQSLRKQRRQDEIDRIPVEGKFGNAKRKGTLDRIMARLARTSESVIHLGFIVLNLDKWLKAVLFWLGCRGLISRMVHLRVWQRHSAGKKPFWSLSLLRSGKV